MKYVGRPTKMCSIHNFPTKLQLYSVSFCRFVINIYFDARRSGLL